MVCLGFVWGLFGVCLGFAWGLFTQEESHSGGTSVELYTNVTVLSTLMSQW